MNSLASNGAVWGGWCRAVVDDDAIYESRLESLRRLVGALAPGGGSRATYFLHAVHQLPDRNPSSADRTFVRRAIETATFAHQRFIRAQDRILSRPASDLSPYAWLCAQGTTAPPTFRGYTCIKSPVDLAIYTRLIEELRPGIVLELGSGEGGSALWLSSLCAALGVDAEIISIDRIRPLVPTAESNRVSFIEGELPTLPPAVVWQMNNSTDRRLVIDDAHADTIRMMRSLEQIVRPGDYLVVEDSFEKQTDLLTYLQSTACTFSADNALLDFYGTNSSSAVNAIWRVETNPT